MKIQKTGIPNRSESAGVLLGQVVRILRRCGLSSSQLDDIYEKAINDTKSIAEPSPSATGAQLSFRCSEVVLRWRLDHRFLTNSGAPRQLALADRAPSFVELATAAAPGESPTRLLEAMKELGAVRVIGRNKVKLVT